MGYRWEKRKITDEIWWFYEDGHKGDWIFSFDKKKKYNMLSDYPDKLTEEERKIFERENPYWVKWLSERG